MVVPRKNAGTYFALDGVGANGGPGDVFLQCGVGALCIMGRSSVGGGKYWISFAGVRNQNGFTIPAMKFSILLFFCIALSLNCSSEQVEPRCLRGLLKNLDMVPYNGQSTIGVFYLTEHKCEELTFYLLQADHFDTNPSPVDCFGNNLLKTHPNGFCLEASVQELTDSRIVGVERRWF